MKNISNYQLLVAKLLIDGVPKKSLGLFFHNDSADQSWIVDDKGKQISFIQTTKRDTSEEVYGFKAIEKEIKARGIRPILPVLPQKGKILIERIEIERKLKKSSLSLPSSVKQDDVSLMTEHPFQATVVGIGSDIDYPGLGIGSRIYLNNVPPEIFIYNEQVYYAIPQHLIICLVFK